MFECFDCSHFVPRPESFDGDGDCPHHGLRNEDQPACDNF
jgi:hypothetical protein